MSDTSASAVPEYLRAGMVLRLQPANYKFGEAEIRVRIRDVLGVQVFADGPWLDLEADELFPQGGTRRVLVAVRVAALAASITD